MKEKIMVYELYEEWKFLYRIEVKSKQIILGILCFEYIHMDFIKTLEHNFIEKKTSPQKNSKKPRLFLA